MLAVSCGTALHHALVALAAEGWAAQVDRLPDAADPDLLARVTITGRTDVTAAAMRKLQTARIRHTDRRPVSDTPVEAAALDAILHTAEVGGAHIHVLRPDVVLELAAAAARAQDVEGLDPSWRDEIAYWASGKRGDGFGIPDDVIPATPPETTVPARDFGHGGTLPVGSGHDRAAVYAILYANEDTPVAWLRAGEALSAIWLESIEHGLTLLPLSAAAEVIATRTALRHMLSELGEPLLVVRLGIADPAHAGPPHTPRVPSQQVIEIVE
jgi:hypothetical protein